MSADKISIGLIQLTAAETPAENLRKTIPQIEAAAAQGAKIIGLQEMFTTKYLLVSVSDVKVISIFCKSA